MKPTVSVIIPSYDHAAFVGAAVRSALDQSFGDLEVVVTDDGSTDGTPDVVRRFDDPRVRLNVLPDNRGAAIAINDTIERARGEFLCMLSSDDFFLPGKIEKEVRFLRENPGIAAVFGLPKLVDESGAPYASEPGPFAVFGAPFRENLTTRADWLRRFFFKGNCLCHPTAMVRRSVFDAIGRFDPRLANLPDFDLWVRLCARFDIHVMREELTAMRIRDGMRNMSAPRDDTRRRVAIEEYLALRHYREVPDALLRETFAAEIAAHPAWGALPPNLLLVEVCRLVGRPAHWLLAFDALSDEAERDGDYRRLIDFTGSVDLFGVLSPTGEAGRGQLSALRVEVARLRTVLERVGRGLQRLQKRSLGYKLGRGLGGLGETVDRLRSLVDFHRRAPQKPAKADGPALTGKNVGDHIADAVRPGGAEGPVERK